MKQLEEEIRQYLHDRDWLKTMKPSDLAKSISIESAELLELFQWNDTTVSELLKDKERLKRVREELADVFIYALDMSVILELDTKKLILDKLTAVKEKYPAQTIKEGDHQTYQNIKQKHRQKSD